MVKGLTAALLAVALLFLLPGRARAQNFVTLHAFVEAEGKWPLAGLAASGNTLYGTTSQGGVSNGTAYNSGTVFAINNDGSGFAVLHYFTGPDGAVPAAPVIVSGNTLYGTTSQGGPSGSGTVFSVNTDGSGFVNLHRFTAVTGTNNTNLDGATPVAGLLLLGGTLYGTTEAGGASGDGTVFSVNTNGTGFAVLHSFGGADGSMPMGGLALYSYSYTYNSNLVAVTNLYGTTEMGGSSGAGTIFGIDPAGTNFQSLLSFPATVNSTNGLGCYPQTGLAGSGPDFVGTTSLGGSLASGTLFSFNYSGKIAPSLVHTFNGSNEGYIPNQLLITPSGALHGTTQTGGVLDAGTVFDTTDFVGDGFQVVYNVPGISGGGGGKPMGALVQSGNALYGVTEYNGNDEMGTVYSSLPPTLGIASTGNQSVLYWSSLYPNYVLQTTTNPSSTNWVAVSNSTPIIGATVTNSGPAAYFRLQYP